MSAYTIHEVTTREEVEAMTDVAWRAWEDPYLPNIRIAQPIHGNLAADRERAVVASKERLWNDFSNKSASKLWLCVKDESGQIVGSVVCDFAEGSPWPDGCPKLDLYWWPQGEEVKLFCEEMMNQVYTPRSLWMHRPHGGMWNLMVDPSHRGKGVAKMLVMHNAKQLDERGIEGFVEATEAGRPVYEKLGYQVVMKLNSYIPAGKGIEWVRWHHEMGMTPWYAMWRPKFGKIEPGERTKPWQ